MSTAARNSTVAVVTDNQIETSVAEEIRHRGLDQVASPEINEKDKRIHAHWRSSAANMGKDTYGWIDGQLVLLERVEDQHSDAGCTRSHFKRVGGKLMLQSNEGCK